MGWETLPIREISAYRSMGHLSIANVDRFHINLLNPASVALLGTSAYEVGANAKNATFKEGSNQANNWSGNLDYIAIGFPLKTRSMKPMKQSNKNTSWAWHLDLTATPAQPTIFPLPTALKM